jgi:hypothetical protein
MPASADQKSAGKSVVNIADSAGGSVTSKLATAKASIAPASPSLAQWTSCLTDLRAAAALLVDQESEVRAAIKRVEIVIAAGA